MPPVARAIQPKPLRRGRGFEDIDGARRGAFRFRVKRDARPESGLQHQADGVLLHVIDNDPRRIHSRVPAQQIDDQPRALPFVLEMRRMHEDQLPMPHRQLDVLLQDAHLVSRVFVQPDLADPEHVRAREKLRDHGQDLARQTQVFRLLRD